MEDYELTHRLRDHAVREGMVWRTAVVGASHARTDAPSTVGAFLRQRRRWFGGFLQTQLWYRHMVATRRMGAWAPPCYRLRPSTRYSRYTA